jgi:hypothetical protein
MRYLETGFKPAIFLAAAFLCMTWLMPVEAGSIRNTDTKEYQYTVHWEDLSPPQPGVLAPGEEKTFADKDATVVLHGQNDNIYVRSGERILISNGVMRIEPEDAAAKPR